MPQLSSRAVSIPGLPCSEDLALVPFLENQLVAVDNSGWQLYRFPLASPEAAPEIIALYKPLPTEHPETDYDFKRHFSPLTLCPSPDGRWLAWAQTLGADGGVLELKSGRQILTLNRAPYCEDVSPFPLGFVTLEQRLVLVYATAWNRIDATDIASGKLLTERGPTESVGKQKPPHYLNYFHSSLSVSPGSTWLITNGWAWHPCGCMGAWRTDAWLGKSGNVWESEDGLTKFYIEETSAVYFWDRPHCWLDDDTIAFWGRGDDDEELEDALGIYSLPERKLLRWVEGPHARDGFLAFEKDEGVLIAVSPKSGTTLWDIQSGEKLVEENTLHPRLWHPGLKALIATGDENSDAVHVIRWNH
ncbi:MAG: hypothetical protein QM758_17980 [Armatimonas sp.]